MAAAGLWRAWLPVAITFALPGCLVTLESGLACGDGFVDRRAGEDCDPAAAREAFACGSAAFISGCDPDSCRCTLCGDGILDDGEECDGTDVDGELCLDGTDAVSCRGCVLDYGDCPLCGNGRRDPGEECDYLATGDFLNPTDCSELPSPFREMRPYASGQVTTCATDCRFDRSGCGFCGNNEVDPSYNNLMGMITFPETCDGDKADIVKLAMFCKEVCFGTAMPDIKIDCAFECSADCRSLEEVEDPQCCLVKGELCPGPDSSDKCCWELDPANEESPLGPCEEIVTGPLLSSVCR